MATSQWLAGLTRTRLAGSKISRIACRAMPSVKSLAYTDTYASVACVRASNPESAASDFGIIAVSTGSMIATVGVSA